MNEKQREEKKMREKKEKQIEKTQEKQLQRQKVFQPPKENTPKIPSNQSTSLDVTASLENIKKRGQKRKKFKHKDRTGGFCSWPRKKEAKKDGMNNI